MSADIASSADDQDGFVYGRDGSRTEDRSLAPEEAWEHFESLLWAYGLAFVRQELDATLGEIEDDITDGRRPTHEQVAEARSLLTEAEVLVEDYYAPLAIDVSDDREVGDT